MDVPSEVCKYLTSPSMALFASNYEEHHGPSTAMFLPPILSSSMETHVTMTTLLTSSPLEVIFFLCVVGMEVLANGPSVALQGDDTTKHEMSSQLDYSTAPHNPVEMSVPTSKNPDTLAMVQAEMVLFPTFPQPELVIATKSGISKENAFSTLDLSSPLPPSSLETHETMAPLLTSSSMAIVTTNYKEDHGPTNIRFLPPILSSSEKIHGSCTTLG